MDEKLQRLRRRAAEGVAPRLELLHALQRAGRPLGDAWSGSRIPVVVQLDAPDKETLEFLAAFDPHRAEAHLVREGSEARLAKIDGGELRVERGAHGFSLKRVGADTETWRSVATWYGEPWRWRADFTYVTHLACTGGILARVLSSGSLQVGPVYGGVSWERPLTAVVRAVAIHRDELLLVDDHLRRFDLESGAVRSELALDERVLRASCYHGWVALAYPTSRIVVYDAHDRLRWDKRVGWECRCLSLGPHKLALAGVNVKVFDRDSGLEAGAIERAYRVTGTWEDPESTMGMGRDVREIREYDPSMVGVAWRAGDHLLVANEMGGLSEWTVGPDGNRCLRKLGRVHPLGTRGPLIAGGPEDRIALTPGDCASTLAYGVGPQPRAIPMEPKERTNASAAISALAVSSHMVWIARTNGSVEHHELPGVKLHPPK